MTKGLSVSPVGTPPIEQNYYNAYGNYSPYGMMPFTYGLGDYGLNTNAAYGNYDNYMLHNMGYGMGYTTGYGMNSMMSMNGSIFPYGAYNPLFMGQITAQSEINQANHASNMHSMMLENEVTAHRQTHKAQIDKILTDASVERCVHDLYEQVRAGNQDGICKEFDRLKQQIYQSHADSIKARGSAEDPNKAATQLIDELYTAYISAQFGVTADLETDIKKYGDAAFTNGYKQGHRRGHHTRYVDETIQHCYGRDIDEKEAKDNAQKAGKIVGSSVNALEWGAAGAAAGTTAYAITHEVLGGIKLPSGKTIPKVNLKGAGKAGLIVGALVAVGDFIWKLTDRDTATA